MPVRNSLAAEPNGEPSLELGIWETSLVFSVASRNPHLLKPHVSPLALFPVPGAPGAAPGAPAPVRCCCFTHSTGPSPLMSPSTSSIGSFCVGSSSDFLAWRDTQSEEQGRGRVGEEFSRETQTQHPETWQEGITPKGPAPRALVRKQRNRIESPESFPSRNVPPVLGREGMNMVRESTRQST